VIGRHEDGDVAAHRVAHQDDRLADHFLDEAMHQLGIRAKGG